MFAGGPAAMAYSRFDAATRAAVHAEYLASLAGYRDGDGYAVPGEFVFVAGARGQVAEPPERHAHPGRRTTGQEAPAQDTGA
jgi:hypothetical protein